MRAQIYSFIFLMWILMLVGGGLMVVVIGPFSLGGFGGVDPIILSGIKNIDSENKIGSVQNENYDSENQNKWFWE